MKDWIGQNCESLLGDAFKANKLLKGSWVKSFDNICKTLNLNQNRRQLKRHLEFVFSNRWNNAVKKPYNNKLRTYALVKNNFDFENYLDSINNNEHRIALTRLRTSSHYLRIETGRFSKNAMQNDDDKLKLRVFKLCDGNHIEDEKHFLVECNYYKHLRRKFVNSLSEKVPNVETLIEQPDMLFMYLMSCEGEESKLVGKYCHEAFEARALAFEFIPKSPKQCVTKAGRIVKRRTILDL